MRFIKVIREINATIAKIFLFEGLINATLIFLIVYVVLMLINFHPISAVVPALVYFVSYIIRESKEDKVRIVEDKYELLNEKLRTARDNVKQQNPLIEALQQEVIGDMHKVRMSAFIDTKKDAYRITACVVLSFLILILALFDVHFVDFNFIDEINFFGKGGSGAGGEGDVAVGGSAENEDIYGAESFAQLGDEELRIEIKPVSYELNAREIEEAPKREFKETFPKEVFLKSSESFKDEIPVDQQELVKAYFKKLAKG